MFLNNSILLLNISVLQILYFNSIKIEGSFKIKNKILSSICTLVF